MIGLALTLDYEIYGDGQGTLENHVIHPTQKFLDICDMFNAKATLFVEVAELLAMKNYSCFVKDVSRVENQLCNAHENGHDVQLHIHPWWFDARYINGMWELNYENASLCSMSAEESLSYIVHCKKYLEDLMKNCSRPYSCTSFRAGSWAMMPTRNIHDALSMAGIRHDSSVYRWGTMNTQYTSYDYTSAFSNILPWIIDRQNINKIKKSSDHNGLLEIPIYTEHQRGYRFLTLKRMKLYPRIRSAIHEKNNSSSIISVKEKRLKKSLDLLIQMRPKKLDFCKCTFHEMKQMLFNILQYNSSDNYLPVVAIGHSKDFIYTKDLLRFLSFVETKHSTSVEIKAFSAAANTYLEHQRSEDVVA